MIEAGVLAAIIGGFFAIAGSLVTTLANYLSEKSKIKKNEKAQSREERLKWLDGRRDAYINFILAFSKPLSSSNIQDDWMNLIKASSEAYLYGNLSPGIPFSINTFSVLYDFLNEKELREIINESLTDLPEFKLKYDDLTDGSKVDSLLDLVSLLANSGKIISLYPRIKQESEDGKKFSANVIKYSELIRTKALAVFLPIFLSTVENEGDHNLNAS